jgi:putative Mn2+ efflux pump MntP
MWVLNSILLGVGLAMDAFSVSIVNGLNEADMKRSRMCMIASTYGAYQTAMPLIGWVCVNWFMHLFESFQKFIPWIAFILLLFIGGKMLFEAFNGKKENGKDVKLSSKDLHVQGIATSIDALSVGFVMASCSMTEAVLSVIIIGAVTFIICLFGLKFGKALGEKLEKRAAILGGVILILIGIKIMFFG